MVLHPVYAQIVGTQVKNIICVSTGDIYIAHQLTEASFGKEAIAVECSQYPVSVGDYFVDGVFYKADKEDPSKAGSVIKRINTPDEDAYEANAKATAVQLEVAELSVNTEYLMMLADEDAEVE